MGGADGVLLDSSAAAQCHSVGSRGRCKTWSMDGSGSAGLGDDEETGEGHSVNGDVIHSYQICDFCISRSNLIIP